MSMHEMQEFRDSVTGQVLEGTIRQPEGLEAEIQRIYDETAAEVPHGDPIPPQDVLLLTPREGEDWMRRFWDEANAACYPGASFDRHDTSVALPRVVVRFPYDPEIFVDENVRVRFSIFGPDDLDLRREAEDEEAVEEELQNILQFLPAWRR
ncbi:hypothetical protein C8J56DRAFT_900765 [Mycena floridula]|nr:hypothetical protein C8J56DRAFT_900765 [Mycena floridula]